MMMVAYSTGMRGIDIVTLKFDSIDWDKCELRIVQEKTGKPLALPFDTVTGNAIADYILNARPECDSDYVFLRLMRPYTRLSSMWTLVAHYARSALGETGKMNGPTHFGGDWGGVWSKQEYRLPWSVTLWGIRQPWQFCNTPLPLSKPSASAADRWIQSL